MGLVLFPGDGDPTSPDVSWSYGFDLSEMWGFGGEQPWSEVSTVLEPLLDHPDVGGDDLSPADCAAILPRLAAIADQWAQDGDDTLLHEHIEEGRQLTTVLRLCIEKNVPLCFL